MTGTDNSCLRNRNGLVCFLMTRAYNNPYSHGFFRCAAASPVIALGRPDINAARQISEAEKCHEQNVGVVVFPELSLSGYTLGDLFQQHAMLEACKAALIKIIDESARLTPLIITGLPLVIDNRLFNCAALVQKGRLLGIVPKTWLPDYREFYEKRQFCCSAELIQQEVTIGGFSAPIGTDLLFACSNLPYVTIGVEICEDVWAPVQPSTWAALAGATLICNLSASNIVIGKADYRRLLVKASSGRNICGYLYCASGQGESTTDLAWDGHLIIAENGSVVTESTRFAIGGSICMSDLDLEKMQLERIRNNSFRDCSSHFASRLKSFRTVHFDLPGTCDKDIPLIRAIQRFPFVPDADIERHERCEEVFNIQTQGLVTRLQATGLKKVVIGISGGLDSTLALLVACMAFDKLGLNRKHIIAVTMPGFATSDETRKSAVDLMKAMGVSVMEIDIRPSCMQMLKDLKHPFSEGSKKYDITFENVQAGERTSHLFRLANQNGGIVIGTGDLSELALGWCTYGVGDHMSHYNVNASVPKTLVRFLIAHVAATSEPGSLITETLHKVLNTTISPELIPGENNNQQPQQTEATVGPYELQDFNLYYISRFGFKPSKIAYLANHAWKSTGKYRLSEIKHWLSVFLKRFFGSSQFKRSCVPDSPKVGSGGSLSPRGDWRAPSDASPEIWLQELEENC